LWFSLDAKIGLTLGKDLALVELGRRQSKERVTARTRNDEVVKSMRRGFDHINTRTNTRTNERNQ